MFTQHPPKPATSITDTNNYPHHSNADLSPEEFMEEQFNIYQKYYGLPPEEDAQEIHSDNSHKYSLCKRYCHMVASSVSALIDAGRIGSLRSYIFTMPESVHVAFRSSTREYLHCIIAMLSRNGILVVLDTEDNTITGFISTIEVVTLSIDETYTSCIDSVVEDIWHFMQTQGLTDKPKLSKDGATAFVQIIP